MVVCVGLVATCYVFVDRPVAFFVHAYKWKQIPWFRWFTDVPPMVEVLAPGILALLVIRRAWGPFMRWELALLAGLICLIVAEQFRDTLSRAFGRYWPDTWINDNPSLIQNDAYGFHPFHSSEPRGWYDSFPSGHTARTVGILTVFWSAFPRWPVRAFCILATCAVVSGLIVNNYHFVGDVIAGGFVGGILGMYFTHAVIEEPAFFRGNEKRKTTNEE